MTNAEDQDFRQQLLDRIRRYSEQRDRVQEKLQELHHTLLTTQKRLEMASEMFRLEFNEEPPGALPQKDGTKELREELTEQLASLDALRGETVTATRRLTRRMRSGGQSWNEAVLEVLQQAGQPLHVKELWARLQASGFESESQDPLRSVASVLVRHPDAVRTGRNTYGLAAQQEDVSAEDDRRNEEQGVADERPPQLALDRTAPQPGTPYSHREEVA